MHHLVSRPKKSSFLRVSWLAERRLSSQQLVECGTWTRVSSLCQSGQCNSLTHKTSTAQRVYILVFPVTGWERRHFRWRLNTSQIFTDLALIGCLCHELCQGRKGIIKLCVASLKRQQKRGAWLEYRWANIKLSKGQSTNWRSDITQKPCRHLDRDMRVFLYGSRGLGCTSAGPVHAAPGGPLQHLATQAGRALQGRLKPGVACHDQVM